MSNNSATHTNEREYYQGHLADGSSVQKHSAGGMYPAVIYFQHGQYGIITPDNQAGSLYASYDAAIEAGMKWKAAH
jgi:hypothetical protein